MSTVPILNLDNEADEVGCRSFVANREVLSVQLEFDATRHSDAGIVSLSAIDYRACAGIWSLG